MNTFAYLMISAENIQMQQSRTVDQVVAKDLSRNDITWHSHHHASLPYLLPAGSSFSTKPQNPSQELLLMDQSWHARIDLFVILGLHQFIQCEYL